MRVVLICAVFILAACSETEPKNGDAGATPDSAVGSDDGTPNNGQIRTFGCYLDTCVVGVEYCPGTFCTGEPAVGDEPCEAGCLECLQGAGGRLCNCSPPQCIELPAECDACDCIPDNTGCECNQDVGGAIRVECLSP